jgi:aromatic-L-amino-acid decarboxylase
MKGTDEDNQSLLARLNASGIAFTSGSVLDGRFVLRLAIGNLGTRRDDVFTVWEKLRELAG